MKDVRKKRRIIPKKFRLELEKSFIHLWYRLYTTGQIPELKLCGRYDRIEKNCMLQISCLKGCRKIEKGAQDERYGRA